LSGMTQATSLSGSRRGRRRQSKPRFLRIVIGGSANYSRTNGTPETLSGLVQRRWLRYRASRHLTAFARSAGNSGYRLMRITSSCALPRLASYSHKGCASQRWLTTVGSPIRATSVESSRRRTASPPQPGQLRLLKTVMNTYLHSCADRSHSIGTIADATAVLSTFGWDGNVTGRVNSRRQQQHAERQLLAAD
jgi:hypothetical protein